MKNLLMAIGLLLTVFVSNSQTVSSATSKIPLNAWNWYQLNNTGDDVTVRTGLQQLTDSILTESVFMGWGKLLPNYDCIYNFRDLKDVYISKIRLYDGEGSFADKPFKLYARTSFSKPAVLLTTFKGEERNKWKEINFAQPVQAGYLVINTSGQFPNEIELYGTYKKPAIVTPPAPKEIKFSDMAGVNSFIWDFMENWDDINVRDTIHEPKMKLMQSFNQYRDYVDWEKLEPSKGVYSFNPTSFGTWNYDKMYRRLKQEGKTVLACLKTLPGWFLKEYYPADMRDAENVPAPYGSDLLKPASYILQAKLAFQFAARYGSNKNISSSLLGGVLTGLLYPNNPASGARTREVGLDLIKYIECENERDKWWKGRKAYQTAWEYAANLSAFYDGNKNTMGAGVGVKNADPQMKVVIGGIASTSTDYIKGIIDWCREYRGYNADGSVNLCFDVINYHCYSFQDGAGQYGSAKKGAAPELSGAVRFAADFVKLAREYGKEVWITEGGYDINQASPLHAPAIGNKSALAVQADWILRTALLYARQGINRMFFYQAYDENVNNGGQFGSAGLLDRIARKRKPAADFLFQAKNLLKEYSYKETLGSNPYVDRYDLNGQSMYAVVVPDEKGRTANYILSLPTADSAYIYTPKAGSDNMTLQRVKVTAGGLRVTATETPIFIKPVAGRKSIPTLPQLTPPADSANNLEVFPNPAISELNFSFETNDKGYLLVRVTDATTAKLWSAFNFVKIMPKFNSRIRVDQLPHGTYYIEVKTPTKVLTRKFIKI